MCTTFSYLLPLPFKSVSYQQLVTMQNGFQTPPLPLFHHYHYHQNIHKCVDYVNGNVQARHGIEQEDQQALLEFHPIPVVFPYNRFHHNHVVLNNLVVANGQQIQDAIPNETSTHNHYVL